MKTLILILTLLVSTTCFADRYYHSGNVQDLLLRPDLDGFAVAYIDGLTSAGSCKRNEAQDRVILSIKGEASEAIYSTLLAAYMAGKSVKISVDDLITDADGHCTLYYVRLNTSF